MVRRKVNSTSNPALNRIDDRRRNAPGVDAVANLAKAHLRMARPTDNLSEVVQFYRDGLGFEVLYEFNDHDGFDGIMLGHKGAAYHLEFTRKRGHTAGILPGPALGGANPPLLKEELTGMETPSVTQPDKFKRAINLVTARALGLPCPRFLLLRADRVVP